MTKNILIASASAIRAGQDKQINYYQYKDGEKTVLVTGAHTNETVPKLLIELLAPQKLDKVILLATPESENVCELLSAELAALSPETEVKNSSAVLRGDSISSGDIFASCQALLGELPEGANIYLDVTGGFRDTAMYLISSIQSIKSQRLKLCQVFYVNFVRGATAENPSPIYDRTEAYKIFDLISGLDELKNYGSTKKLCEYCGGRDRFGIIESLTDFYEEVKIGRINNIDSIVEAITSGIEQYEKSEEKDSVFDRIVAEAKHKYATLLHADRPCGAFDCFRWCHENGHTAMALAILCENLPKYIVDKRIIYTENQDVIDECRVYAKDRNNDSGDTEEVLAKRDWEYFFITSNICKKEDDPNDPMKKAFRIATELSKKTVWQDGCSLVTTLSNNPELSAQVRSLPKDIGKKFNRFVGAVDYLRKNGADRSGGNEALLSDLATITKDIEEKAKKDGRTPDFSNWRILLAGKNRFYSFCGEGKPIKAVSSAEEKCKAAMSALKNGKIRTDIGEEKAEKILEKFYYLQQQRNYVLHLKSGDRDAMKKINLEISEFINLVL